MGRVDLASHCKHFQECRRSLSRGAGSHLHTMVARACRPPRGGLPGSWPTTTGVKTLPFATAVINGRTMKTVADFTESIHARIDNLPITQKMVEG